MVSTTAHPKLTSSIRLPGRRRRRLAARLLESWPVKLNTADTATLSKEIRVICTADTHNAQPDLPSGDILIHAGDLTEHGSFAEMQQSLDWLASQPHAHKIVIAGNHDVLLDERFLQKRPERRYGQQQTLANLDWHDLIHLQESHVCLDVGLGSSGTRDTRKRKLKVYGSPYTPQYGVSAFQYDASEDRWTGKIDSDTDIVVCHGPPHLHLDRQGIHNAGDAYFAHELARVRPRLVVFGHIHVAYGQEDLFFNKTLLLHDDIQRDWTAWVGLAQLASRVCWTKLRCLLQGRSNLLKNEGVTTLVNASYGSQKSNPIVVEI